MALKSYKVKHNGESLNSIAMKLYGNEKFAKLIWLKNKGLFAGGAALKAGDVLSLAGIDPNKDPNTIGLSNLEAAVTMGIPMPQTPMGNVPSNLISDNEYQAMISNYAASAGGPQGATTIPDDYYGVGGPQAPQMDGTKQLPPDYQPPDVDLAMFADAEASFGGQGYNNGLSQEPESSLPMRPEEAAAQGLMGQNGLAQLDEFGRVPTPESIFRQQMSLGLYGKPSETFPVGIPILAIGEYSGLPSRNPNNPINKLIGQAPLPTTSFLEVGQPAGQMYWAAQSMKIEGQVLQALSSAGPGFYAAAESWNWAVDQLYNLSGLMWMNKISKTVEYLAIFPQIASGRNVMAPESEWVNIDVPVLPGTPAGYTPGTGGVENLFQTEGNIADFIGGRAKPFSAPPDIQTYQMKVTPQQAEGSPWATFENPLKFWAQLSASDYRPLVHHPESGTPGYWFPNYDPGVGWQDPDTGWWFVPRESVVDAKMPGYWDAHNICEVYDEHGEIPLWIKQEKQAWELERLYRNPDGTVNWDVIFGERVFGVGEEGNRLENNLTWENFAYNMSMSTGLGGISLSLMLDPSKISEIGQAIRDGADWGEVLIKAEDPWAEAAFNTMTDPFFIIEGLAGLQHMIGMAGLKGVSPAIARQLATALKPSGVLDDAARVANLAEDILFPQLTAIREGGKLVKQLPIGQLIQKVPVMGWLAENSTRSQLTQYTNEAANVLESLGLRMSNSQYNSVGDFYQAALLKDATVLSKLSPRQQVIWHEVVTMLQEEGMDTLGDLLAKHGTFERIPDAITGVLTRRLQGEADAATMAAYIERAINSVKASKLGIQSTYARSIAAGFSWSGRLLRENWLGANPRYLTANYVDNKIKTIVSGYAPSAFDANMGEKTVRHFEQMFGTNVPRSMSEGLIKDAIGIDQLSRGLATGDIPIPFIGKPSQWDRPYKFVAGKKPPKVITDYLNGESSIVKVLESLNLSSLYEAGFKKTSSIETAARMNIYMQAFEGQYYGQVLPKVIDVGKSTFSPETLRAMKHTIRSYDDFDYWIKQVTPGDAFRPNVPIEGLAPENMPDYEFVTKLREQLRQIEADAIRLGSYGTQAYVDDVVWRIEQAAAALEDINKASAAAIVESTRTTAERFTDMLNDEGVSTMRSFRPEGALSGAKELSTAEDEFLMELNRGRAAAGQPVIDGSEFSAAADPKLVDSELARMEAGMAPQNALFAAYTEGMDADEIRDIALMFRDMPLEDVHLVVLQNYNETVRAGMPGIGQANRITGAGAGAEQLPGYMDTEIPGAWKAVQAEGSVNYNLGGEGEYPDFTNVNYYELDATEFDRGNPISPQDLIDQDLENPWDWVPNNSVDNFVTKDLWGYVESQHLFDQAFQKLRPGGRIMTPWFGTSADLDDIIRMADEAGFELVKREFKEIADPNDPLSEMIESLVWEKPDNFFGTGAGAGMPGLETESIALPVNMTPGPNSYNLGAGEDFMEGWNNVDILAEGEPDYIHYDLNKTPWEFIPEGTAENLNMSDVVDWLDLTPEQLADQLDRALISGGKISVYDVSEVTDSLDQVLKDRGYTLTQQAGIPGEEGGVRYTWEKPGGEELWNLDGIPVDEASGTKIKPKFIEANGEQFSIPTVSELGGSDTILREATKSINRNADRSTVGVFDKYTGRLYLGGSQVENWYPGLDAAMSIDEEFSTYYGIPMFTFDPDTKVLRVIDTPDGFREYAQQFCDIFSHQTYLDADYRGWSVVVNDGAGTDNFMGSVAHFNSQDVGNYIADFVKFSDNVQPADTVQELFNNYMGRTAFDVTRPSEGNILKGVYSATYGFGFSEDFHNLAANALGYAGKDMDLLKLSYYGDVLHFEGNLTQMNSAVKELLTEGLDPRTPVRFGGKDTFLGDIFGREYNLYSDGLQDKITPDEITKIFDNPSTLVAQDLSPEEMAEYLINDFSAAYREQWMSIDDILVQSPEEILQHYTFYKSHDPGTFKGSWAPTTGWNFSTNGSHPPGAVDITLIGPNEMLIRPNRNFLNDTDEMKLFARELVEAGASPTTKVYTEGFGSDSLVGYKGMYMGSLDDMIRRGALPLDRVKPLEAFPFNSNLEGRNELRAVWSKGEWFLQDEEIQFHQDIVAKFKLGSVASTYDNPELVRVIMSNDTIYADLYTVEGELLDDQRVSMMLEQLNMRGVDLNTTIEFSYRPRAGEQAGPGGWTGTSGTLGELSQNITYQAPLSVFSFEDATHATKAQFVNSMNTGGFGSDTAVVYSRGNVAWGGKLHGPCLAKLNRGEFHVTDDVVRMMMSADGVLTMMGTPESYTEMARYLVTELNIDPATHILVTLDNASELKGNLGHLIPGVNLEDAEVASSVQQWVMDNAKTEMRNTQLAKLTQDYQAVNEGLAQWADNVQKQSQNGGWGYKGDNVPWEDEVATIEKMRTSWIQETDVAQGYAVSEVDRVLFDYQNKTNAEELLRYASPFTTWQLRNPMFWAQAISQNPGLLNVITRYMHMSEVQRKQNFLSSRFQGMIGTQTADGGYVGLNPNPLLSFFSQFQEPFQTPEQDSFYETQKGLNKTLQYMYQGGKKLGITPWPWLSYGMEQIGAIAPGTTQISFGPMQRLVELGMVAAGQLDPGEGIFPSPSGEFLTDYYVERAIVEIGQEWGLTYEQMMEATGNPDHPLYQQAQERVKEQQLATGAYSLVSPFGLKYASPGEVGVRGDVAERADVETYEAREDFDLSHPAVRMYRQLFGDDVDKEISRIRLDYENRLVGLDPWTEEYKAIVGERAVELDRLYGGWETNRDSLVTTLLTTPINSTDPDTVRTTVLFRIQAMEPRAGQYLEDGEINWEKFEIEYEQYMEQIPEYGEYMGYDLTLDEYLRFKYRNATPEKIAYDMYKEWRNDAWDKYESIQPGGEGFTDALNMSLSWQQQKDIAAGFTLHESDMLRAENAKLWVRDGIPYEYNNRLIQDLISPQNLNKYAGAVAKMMGIDPSEGGMIDSLVDQLDNEMPGIWGEQTAAEQAGSELYNYYGQLTPSEKRVVREAFGLETFQLGDLSDPEVAEKVLEMYSKLKQSELDLAKASGTGGRVVGNSHYFMEMVPKPSGMPILPPADKMNAVESRELEQVRRDWFLYERAKEEGHGAEWTPLMDKYYGSADTPSAKFWDAISGLMLRSSVYDDPYLSAIFNAGSRAFVPDEMYVAALERFEKYREIYIDQARTTESQAHPEWAEAAAKEQTQLSFGKVTRLELIKAEYYSLDAFGKRQFKKENPEDYAELDVYMDEQIAYQVRYPNYLYIYKPWEYVKYFGQTKPHWIDPEDALKKSNALLEAFKDTGYYLETGEGYSDYMKEFFGPSPEEWREYAEGVESVYTNKEQLRSLVEEYYDMNQGERSDWRLKHPTEFDAIAKYLSAPESERGEYWIPDVAQ